MGPERATTAETSLPVREGQAVGLAESHPGGHLLSHELAHTMRRGPRTPKANGVPRHTGTVERHGETKRRRDERRGGQKMAEPLPRSLHGGRSPRYGERRSQRGVDDARAPAWTGGCPGGMSLVCFELSHTALRPFDPIPGYRHEALCFFASPPTLRRPLSDLSLGAPLPFICTHSQSQ